MCSDCKLQTSCQIFVQQPAMTALRPIASPCNCSRTLTQHLCPTQAYTPIHTQTHLVYIKGFWLCGTLIKIYQQLISCPCLILAFAVSLLHSACCDAVTGLLGDCFVGWHCLMPLRDWTGLVCIHCCWLLTRHDQTRSSTKLCQAKEHFAGTAHPLACSSVQCGFLPPLDGSVACSILPSILLQTQSEAVLNQ